jgi:VCBS repeat-containing protein
MEAHICPIRLVIADRRPIVVQGLASLLAAERDFAIVASCLDGTSCLKAIRNLTPDVVLVEDGFSDVSASEMLSVVKAENLRTRLVFYTASIANEELAATIAAGSCAAISMREKPETLLQSLRLVAPNPDRKAADQENGLAGLTDQECKILRLVAYGLSNKQIARQLKVSAGAIKAHLDQIAIQLEVTNRRELATFALSRLFGAVGSLAALIFAALDDAQAANTTGVGAASTDTVTVMAADGTEVVTIKINPQQTAAASGKTSKAVIKAGRVENTATETAARSGKPIDPGADIVVNTIMFTALNSPRPSLSSFGTFMMATVAVWVYELLNRGAQAFNLDDSLVALATADVTKLALNTPCGADARLDSFDQLAWQNPDVDHQSFAFDAPRSDPMARRGDELPIMDAATGEPGISGTPHVGSGTIDSPILHGSSEQAIAHASANAQHGTTLAPERDHSPAHGQSQSDLHASEGDGAAGDKQDQPGNDSSHGQSRKVAHAPENGSQDSAQDAKYFEAKPGHSHHDKTPVANASGSSHSEPKRDDEGKDHAVTGPMNTAADSGDSFHFKNELAAAKPSDTFDIHGSHGPDFAQHGSHTGHEEQAPIQSSELMGLSLSIDHQNGAEQHLSHDLIV